MEHTCTESAPPWRFQAPWQAMLMGCLVLPIKLPFSVPGVCRAPRPARTAPARVPQRRPTVVYPTQRRRPVNPAPRRESAPIVRPAPAPQPVAATSLGAMESQVRAEINQIRRSRGLRPLKQNRRLAEVARRHSQNMASRSFFSHTDPNGDTSFERVQNANIPFRLVAENLAWNENAPDPVKNAVQGWMNSSGHRTNILRREVRETGVGIVQNGNQYFFTQLFVKR